MIIETAKIFLERLQFPVRFAICTNFFSFHTSARCRHHVTSSVLFSCFSIFIIHCFLHSPLLIKERILTWLRLAPHVCCQSIQCTFWVHGVAKKILSAAQCTYATSCNLTFRHAFKHSLKLCRAWCNITKYWAFY